MASDKAWNKIFKDNNILNHNFDKKPFVLSANNIKKSCQEFTKTHDKEVRILCKQDTREDRPKVFVDNKLFILPKHNGEYYILRGEGYVDIPDITTDIIDYDSKLEFTLETSNVGDSEMQYLDYAYANSLIRTFMDDTSLVLTIRGRKYTPEFKFRVGTNNLEVSSVQTEVDAGYEGKDSIVLVEAKNFSATNVIIRQLYYPFRQWGQHVRTKKVFPVFFEKRVIDGENIFYIWQFEFTDKDDYNSIKLVQSGRYRIKS
ncbi:type II restriction enzyme [Prevotella dentasini]|uniref:type II restriction enzyme n=1 Tax=Prevotella dentasini TaxID=589537 RepID=UPI0004680A54|nr:hypothetical protein [Prevotella dentasini]